MQAGTESDKAKLVGKTLAQGFACLRFPRVLEDRFQRDGAVSRLRLVMLSGVGSTVFFAGVLSADYFMIPDQFWLAVTMRVGIFIPVVLIGLQIFKHLAMPRLLEWMIALAGIFAALISLGLSLSSDSPQALPHLVILNVVVVYTTMIGRFWPMLFMCASIAFLHGVGLFVLGDPRNSLGIAMSLLLLTTMVFTLYGNYVLEHSDRKVYLVDVQESELQAELALANEALARTARTDPLTGMANRRHFDDFLSQVWLHAGQQRSPVALLLIDIDHFKGYNDRHGHPAGDRCLCSVAQALAGCMRKSGDLVARWGGEEFAIVMSGASPAMAEGAARRVLEAVRAAGLPHGGSPVAPVVTVSVGVASLVPAAGITAQTLTQAADEALYQAKTTGRDQAVMARPAQATTLPDVPLARA